MITPEVAARRFLLSCLLGMVLGFVYGGLRPMRRRFPKLGDGLFLLAAVRLWLELSFRICRGDLRIVYSFGLLAGCCVWEWTAGRLLGPVFDGIWKSLAAVYRIFAFPAKKILDFVKILFASAEKWVTIRNKYYWKYLRKCGGNDHGRKKESAEKREGDRPAQPGDAEDHSDRAYSVFYGGIGSPSVGPQRDPDRDRKPAGRGFRAGACQR